MARFGALGHLDLDHLDLIACSVLLEQIGREAAVLVASAEVTGTELPDQVPTASLVIRNGGFNEDHEYYGYRMPI